MYRKILIALENGPADRTLLPHVSKLALQLQSSILLVHVADGWVARNFEKMNLAESDEMRSDRAYLEAQAQHLRAQGLETEVLLALGDPPSQILKAAEKESCDLIAMTSHGHRFLADLLLGSTIHHVRHRTSIPILVLRATEKRETSTG